MRWAIVALDGQRVGMLAEQNDGFTCFSYDQTWLGKKEALAISLTIPLSHEPLITKGLHPFFENLLPEGWLLELSTAKFKISKDDAFGLLIATCRDCIGAVEVWPAAGENPWSA